MNPKDIKYFRDKADTYAARFHDGKTDKNGKPYIEHPRAVAAMVSDLGYSEDAVLAALLHDVVEDTSATLAGVRNSFGDRVADLVDLVTRRKGRETYFEYIGRVVASRDEEAIIIKLADIGHNTSPERRHKDSESMIKGRYAKAVKLLGEAFAVLNVTNGTRVPIEDLDRIFPHGIPTRG